MRLFITFLLYPLLIFTTNAQETDQILPTVPTKYYFGYSYTPEISYRFLTFHSNASTNGFYYPTSEYVTKRNEYERAKYGYSAQFIFGFRITEKLTLETGLGYTDFGDALKSIEITYGNGPEPQYAAMTGQTHIGLITLPVSALLNLGGQRCKWFVSGGLALGYKLRYDTNFEVEGDEGVLGPGFYVFALDYDEMSSFILEAHVSGGMDLQLNTKTSVRMAPSFKITATDTYHDRPVRGTYFNAGIQLGLIRNF